MKKAGAYTWMAVGGAAGLGLSWLIPGLQAGAGIAIGVATGLAGSTEGFSCHLPWHSDREPDDETNEDS